MRASVMTGVRTLSIEDRPVPKPAREEVLIEVAAVGVCGSDVHYYREGRIGDFVVDDPMILGHELSGRIAAVGESVDAGRIGQRVAVEPQHPCRRCAQCMAGRYNLCPQMKFYATPPVDGAFCRYVTIDADFAHPVPDSVSDEAAALLEPLLPAPVDHVLVQADLTAVAPGPLESSLARRLQVLAEVESRGGATVYRFTPGSVRRALDLGWTAVEVHDFLDEVGFDAIAEHERDLLSYALERLDDLGGISVYGPTDLQERSGVISFTMGDAHPHDISTILDSKGIAIRAGHHCAQLVMQHFGISATARASFYLYNSTDDVDRLIEGLASVKEIFGLA
nr:aminotransferase class V-fold PLP-dependent enzyme [uncultured Rhodococcus sp.]